MDFELRLKALDLSQPKLTLPYLKTLVEALKLELEECEKGWQSGKTRKGEIWGKGSKQSQTHRM